MARVRKTSYFLNKLFALKLYLDYDTVFCKIKLFQFVWNTAVLAGWLK